MMLNTIETFRPFIDFEGIYELSDKGRVKRVARIVVYQERGKEKKRQIKELILKPRQDKDGYNRLEVRLNGKRQHIRIARAVALHFRWNPENKPEVDHLDGDKTNDCVDNLEWVTRSEQMLRAFATGLKMPMKGSKHARAILTERKVSRILALLSRGYPRKRIMERFGISSRTVRAIRCHEQWKHVPDLWKKTEVDSTSEDM